MKTNTFITSYLLIPNRTYMYVEIIATHMYSTLKTGGIKLLYSTQTICFHTADMHEISTIVFSGELNIFHVHQVITSQYKMIIELLLHTVSS